MIEWARNGVQVRMNSTRMWEIILVIVGIILIIYFVQRSAVKKPDKPGGRIITDDETAETLKKELVTLAECRELAKSGGDKEKIDLAKMLNSIGVTYEEMPMREDAISSYRESLKIWDELSVKDSSKHLYSRAVVLDNLAISLKNNDDRSEAERAYLECVDIFEELLELDADKNASMAGLIYKNLADFYTYPTISDKGKAIIYYRKAISALRLSDKGENNSNIIRSIEKELNQISELKDSDFRY